MHNNIVIENITQNNKLNPMMNVRTLFRLFSLIIFVFILSCKSGTKTKKEKINYDSIDLSKKGEYVSILDTAGEGLPIFYNMYLSVEMSSLFQASGTVFEPDLLNPTEKVSEYLTSSKRAINLGVYAVDLSYSRVLDQVEIAGQYFNAMEKISQELGIPSEFFHNSAKRFDRNISDKDSLIQIANEVYVATDNYLKENERYDAAVLIIMGGWTEAIHIACNVAIESENIDILERLAEQKFSLQNLITILTPHKNDEVVAAYLAKLEKLQAKFNRFVVDVSPEFDPSSDQGKSKINEYIKEVKAIDETVNSIRNDMVS